MKSSLESRRRFLQTGLVAAGALTVSRMLGVGPGALAFAKDKAPAKEVPLPAGATKAAESDAVASALGYKENVKDIDFKKFPKRKEAAAKSQNCKNCAYYTAANDGWGKCQMISNGLVSVHGWCGSWSKKA